MNTARVYPLSTDSDLQIFRTLLREYGQHLIRAHGTEHLDLARFEEEIAGLPEPYTIILLAAVTGPGDSSSVVGCIAAKPIKPADSPEKDEVACEMKRLWVRPAFRGLGAGEQLVDSLLAAARAKAYTAMYLDTIPETMTAANRIYTQFGFRRTARYNDNPVPGVVFFRRSL